jgi:hypothetical protein
VPGGFADQGALAVIGVDDSHVELEQSGVCLVLAFALDLDEPRADARGGDLTGGVGEQIAEGLVAEFVGAVEVGGEGGKVLFVSLTHCSQRPNVN